MEIGKPISVTGRHRRKDGSEFPVSVRLGLFETADGEVLMLAICHDITELKATEERLAALNEHLEEEVARRTEQVRHALAERQAIVDNLADGLVACDLGGHVQVANPAANALLGLALDPGAAVASLPAPLLEAIGIAQGERRVVDVQLELPKGRVAQGIVSPIQEDDRVSGTVALVRDVTLEREVDRMKTDFIATVSHELRTPLTSVLGFAKLTRAKVDQKLAVYVPEDDRKAQRALGQIQKNLEIIVSEGERLTALINDVLDISKMEAGRMEWRFEMLDLGALAERAAAATSALFQGDIPLRVDVEPGLPEVRADSDRILQVMINLLSNAAKFTQRGSVDLRVRRSGAGVEVAVADTGRGIDPDLHASVFDKFKQVGDTLTDKPQGTGLGLPICAQIVAAHGSTITLQSELGQGACFAFALTAGGEVDEPVDGLPEARVKPLRAARTDGYVLVVDDDPNLRELLHQQLTDRGFQVRLAANGYEAIGMARAEPPAVIVLDVMMPVISGFDVATVLKADPTTAAVPILILSIVRDEERGYRIGVDRYFTKPADADQLADTVRDLLAGEAESP
ncbi:MAG: response regulator, partial [Myxococcales bacterium]|nr:response regulator [Myxococcales bacterium]